MKKLSLLLAPILAVGMMASACGSAAGTATSGTTAAGATGTTAAAAAGETKASGDMYSVKVAFGVGVQPADAQLVSEAISTAAQEKIGVKVELLPISFSAYTQQINLMLSGGEKLDLMLQFGSTLSNDAAKGQILPLDDLLKNEGAGIVEAVGSDFLKADMVNGVTYAVPSIRDMAAAYGICMRKDILDKYGIDYKSLKTTDDLEKMFATVKAGEPDMTITWGQGSTTTILDQLLVNRDSLGDGFGVLQNRGQDDKLTVVNWAATDEYKQQVALVRDWYNKGYILSDAPTNKESNSSLVKSGKLFSFCSNIKPGFDKQSTNQCGTEMVVAEINPAFTTTTQVSVISWSLPVTCADKSSTMKFLNLMYTDADIVNLFDWGIEGKHYKKTATDNVITYADGVDATNTGYGLNYGWMFGNQLISHVWEGDDPALYTTLKEFNDNAIQSKALGFQFDSTAVKTEVAACTQVVNQFKYALEYGAIDPDENIPKYVEALKAAGIDNIIAEKQKQLDAWVAAQGK